MTMCIHQLWEVWIYIKLLVTGITIKKICSRSMEMDNEAIGSSSDELSASYDGI